RAPVDPPDAGHDAVSRQVADNRVGKQRVLDERALVEQQRQPVAHEKLVLGRQLLGAAFEVAPPRPLADGLDVVLLHAQIRRMARMATSSGSCVSAKSRAASINDLHSTSASTPGSRRSIAAMRSSPKSCSPERASANPSV